MKKFYTFLLLIFCTNFIIAQDTESLITTTPSKNYFTVSLSGGTSGFTMIPNYKNILTKHTNFSNNTLQNIPHPDLLNITNFIGGSFGFGYEYQTTRGFWLSVGIEAQILSGGLHSTCNIQRVTSGIIDSGRYYELECTITNWERKQMNIYATLPFMLGYKHNSGLYFGAGARLGFNLYNIISGDFTFTDINLHLEGSPSIVGIFKEVSLTNKSTDNNFMYLPQVNPMLEIGWQGLDVQNGQKGLIKFKFAIVGEMGTLSSYNNKNSAEQLFNYHLSENFRLDDLFHLFKGTNSLYSIIPLGMSKTTFDELKSKGNFVNFDKPSKLYPWFVGFKFTVLFGTYK